MKALVIASTNPVKIQAVHSGFQAMFPGETFAIHSVSVASGVSDQPSSSLETLRGARNRAQNAARLKPGADFWIGVEGGIEIQNGEMAAFAWVFVQSPTLSGKSRTGTFFLPDEVARLVRQGAELGQADDIVFGKVNSKQKNGAIGILTKNVVDRARLYEQAVILALVPFKNPELYTPERQSAEPEPPHFFEQQRGRFTVSTDPSRMDPEAVHDFLSRHAYWANGIPFQVVQRAAANSLIFGLYDGEQQIGYARVITDFATSAHLGDVYVLQDYRGHGLGKWLVECILSHPELQNLRRWMLSTHDAHGLYARYGFVPLRQPANWMERMDADFSWRRFSAGEGDSQPGI